MCPYPCRDVPERLQCRREVSLQDSAGKDVGRIDLLFEDEAQSFCLLVELKLGSEYHHRQLPNYMDALDALPAAEKGLVAVTKATPHTGEEGLAGRVGWLGSLRWYALFERLYSLDHCDPALADAWRSVLRVMRNHQDFGPMDLTLNVIEAWAKRDEAERILRYLLDELGLTTLGYLRQKVGHSSDDQQAASLVYRGQTSIIWPWRNQPHVKYEVPADAGEERLRLQFLAFEGQPVYTVEARYDHPKERVDDDPDLVRAAEFLRRQGFKDGNDGWGHYWARVVPAKEWARGGEALDLLTSITRASVDDLTESGIFDALGQRSPATPLSTPTDPEDQGTPTA